MSERSPDKGAKEPANIDRRAARRRFDKAARTYSRSSRLESEVSRRMLERLDYVKLAPRRILDAASGPPSGVLGKRYPGAELIALDLSLPMLRQGSLWRRLFAPRLAVCADLGELPLAGEAVDLLWCNMALHWLADPLRVLKEFRRVLAPEGLLMFSTLGPDSLKELRAVAGAARVHDFIDMHDIGDMLVAARFSAPVIDMEMIQIEYKAGSSLVGDLRASGQTNARVDRPRGLAGRGLRERLHIPKVSFEVVYGHAWAGAPKANQEPKTVRVFKRMP